MAWLRRMAGTAACIAWGLLVAGPVGGCLPAQPRLGYPWLESRELELRDEVLDVTLRAVRRARTSPRGAGGAPGLGEGVVAQVHARFHFRVLRALPALGLGFPEDRRDAPLERYALNVDGRPVDAWRRPGGAARGFLPLDDVPHWYESMLPALGRGADVRVDVRYEQPLRRGRFRYLLRTGAYWRGPIGRLRVRVTAGPGVHLRSGELDGRRAELRGDALRWKLVELEPRGDLLVRFAASREVSRWK